MKTSGLQSTYVAVDQTGDQFFATFEPNEALTLGSEKHRHQAIGRVKNLMHRASPIELVRTETMVQGIFPIESLGRVQALLAAIDADLNAFKKEPMFPRVVEEVLGITARERIRWTKDGRLTTSGSGSFWSGHQDVHFPKYPAQLIAALAADPEKILQWRELDAMEPADQIEEES